MRLNVIGAAILVLFLLGCAHTQPKPYGPENRTPGHHTATPPRNYAAKSWPEWFDDRAREKNLQPKARP